MKKLITAAAVMLSAACLSGCALLLYGDGLLALPSLPAGYSELQDEINKVLATGAVSAAAESGSNRQSIQLVDINGDGANETVAFFRKPDGNYLIKAYSKTDDRYEEIGSAEAVGLSLHSIYYPTISATGQKCLAVCWGIDESNSYGMDVYIFARDGMESILNVRYSGIYVGDFNGSGMDELCFAVKDQSDGHLSLNIYSFKGGGYVLDAEEPLCAEARSVAKITMGRIDEETRALYFDSAASGGGYVTDVIYCGRDGRPHSALRDPKDGTGIATWRALEVFSCDIDGDGLLELPRAASSSGAYPDEKNKLEWLGPGDFSEPELVTYHMPSDKWYLKWPDKWADSVAVQTTRYSRMAKTVFFVMPEDTPGETPPSPDEGSILLTIYIFSGDNKQSYISSYGAVELARRDGLVYAYSPGTALYSAYAVDEQEIAERFVNIENEWTAEAY